MYRVAGGVRNVHPAGDVQAGLKERRILVRSFAKPPLDGWLRITIGTREQLGRVLRGITEILQG